MRGHRLFAIMALATVLTASNERLLSSSAEAGEPRVETTTEDGVTTDKHFDEDGKLTKTVETTTEDGVTTDKHFDKDGKLTQRVETETKFGDLQEQRFYDGDGTLTQRVETTMETSMEGDIEVKRTFDAEDQISEITRTLPETPKPGDKTTTTEWRKTKRYHPGSHEPYEREDVKREWGLIPGHDKVVKKETVTRTTYTNTTYTKDMPRTKVSVFKSDAELVETETIIDPRTGEMKFTGRTIMKGTRTTTNFEDGKEKTKGEVIDRETQQWVPAVFDPETEQWVPAEADQSKEEAEQSKKEAEAPEVACSAIDCDCDSIGGGLISGPLKVQCKLQEDSLRDLCTRTGKVTGSCDPGGAAAFPR